MVEKNLGKTLLWNSESRGLTNFVINIELPAFFTKKMLWYNCIPYWNIESESAFDLLCFFDRINSTTLCNNTSFFLLSQRENFFLFVTFRSSKFVRDATFYGNILFVSARQIFPPNFRFRIPPTAATSRDFFTSHKALAFIHSRTEVDIHQVDRESHDLTLTLHSKSLISLFNNLTIRPNISCSIQFDQSVDLTRIENESYSRWQ